MNRDDIIKLAQEAGLLGPEDTAKDIIECGLELWVSGERGMQELERFAALVAAAAKAEENEACAKVCDDKVIDEYATGKVDHNEMAWTDACAAAIRARKENT